MPAFRLSCVRIKQNGNGRPWALGRPRGLCQPGRPSWPLWPKRPDRPQNGPPPLKVYYGSDDFGAHGLRGSTLAIVANVTDRPQNGPPLLKVHYGNDDSGAHGLQRPKPAVAAKGPAPTRPQNDPPPTAYSLRAYIRQLCDNYATTYATTMRQLRFYAVLC